MRSLVVVTLLLFAQCSFSGGKDDVVTISTEYGDITVILFDDTPLHKENFLKLAKEGFYDSTTFHRVMHEFMIQGGDPNSKDEDPFNDGRGGPGYNVPAEFMDHHTHVKGALAAARKPDRINPDKASSGSQFYIVHETAGAHYLDGKYTVYGMTIAGIEVVDQIAAVQVDRRDRPVQDVVMTVTVKRMSRKKIKKVYGYEYPDA